MAEPFEVTSSEQGPVLTPAGQPPPDVGLLPDTGPLVGPPPQLALPPPPPPPPSPTQDPRQQLAALIALGMAVGQGVHGGGAGALEGFNQTQAALRADQLAQYNKGLNDQKLQEGVLKAQFQQDEQNYRQREAKLQSALVNFKTQASKLTDKSQYDALAEAYGNSLKAAGYRTISPDWLRQNIPYVKPSQQVVADKAFTAWLSNTNNKRLLDENPAQAASSMISVDLNGDGVKENLPIAQVAEAAGKGFAHDQTGSLIPVPITTKTGQSAFDIALQGLTDQFKAENRRDPNPKEKNALIDQAIEKTKQKPPGSEKLIKVEHKGPDGKAIVEWLPESEVRGKTFEKPTSGATETRLASAQAVNQTGNDIIAKLSDPAFAASVGPVMGRFSSLRDFIGNPPPEYAELAGMIESYALANMGVHGMRSAQGAQQISKLLDGHHTPASLIAAIKGLQGFSSHFLQNEGRQAPSAAPAPGGLPTYQDYLRSKGQANAPRP